MIDGITARLLRALRVPPQPRLPAGEPGTARVFRAGRNYWNLRLAQWGAKQLFTLGGFVFLMFLLQTIPPSIDVKGKGQKAARSISLAGPMTFVREVELVFWVFWLLQLPVTFAVIRMDYELRWYIVTDRAARLREGVVSMTEMTFTLANVQDIRILQGPLQRLLGLADVELRTAGGGDSSPAAAAHGGRVARNLHLARFRGVDDAEAIRDLVLERMKKARGAGLGDPDDVHVTESAPAPESVAAAARELVAASAALRAAAQDL